MASTRCKLLICLPYLTPSIGGGAIVLLNLLEPLAEAGFDIGVIYFQDEARRLIPSMFRAYALRKNVGAAKYYAQYARVLIGMANILRQERPDVILCNSYQPFWICLGARKISGSRAALVTGEQNNLTSMFEGAKWGRLRSYLTRRLDPRADRIIVPCSALYTHLVTDFSVEAEKIVTIPNPVVLERIQELSGHAVEHPWFSQHDRPVILSVGVLDKQKDQGTLLRAFAIVRRNMPARCVLLGDGPLRGKLENEAKALGVADDVAFLGFQENPFKFMARADVFVLSSQYEGFGMVLVEAMACGCPVVSTRCPYGPEEIVARSGEEAAGLLVPVNHPDALAESVVRVLEDATLRRRLSENGKRRAQDFSARAIATRYAEVLASLRTKSP